MVGKKIYEKKKKFVRYPKWRIKAISFFGCILTIHNQNCSWWFRLSAVSWLEWWVAFHLQIPGCWGSFHAVILVWEQLGTYLTESEGRLLYYQVWVEIDTSQSFFSPQYYSDRLETSHFSEARIAASNLFFCLSLH